MKLAASLDIERQLDHVDGVVQQRLLRLSSASADREVAQRLVQWIDVQLGSRAQRGTVAQLKPDSAFEDLCRCDGFPMPPAVLTWERETILSPGFGRYPTYAQWFAVLVEALRTGTMPRPAALDGYDTRLLDRARSWARLFLATASTLGQQRYLSRVDLQWPTFAPEDAKAIPVPTRSMLYTRFKDETESMIQTLQLLHADVPDAPPPVRMRTSDALTVRLTWYIAYARELILAFNSLISTLSKSQLEPTPDQTNEHAHEAIDLPAQQQLRSEQGEVSDALGSNVIVRQVKDFRNQIGEMLNDVEKGKVYLIRAKSKALAIIRPYAPAEHGTPIQVTRKEFAVDSSRLLNRAREGEVIGIVRAVEHEHLPEVVLVRPPAALLREPTEEERRRADAERKRRERGSDISDRRRQHDLERHEQAERDAKLRAVEGMTSAEVREAVKLWKAHKK